MLSLFGFGKKTQTVNPTVNPNVDPNDPNYGFHRQDANDCIYISDIAKGIIKKGMGNTLETAIQNTKLAVSMRPDFNPNQNQLIQCVTMVWNQVQKNEIDGNYGGARKSSGASHVRFQGTKRKVHLDGRKKYIKFNGAVVYLKDVRGKYCAV